MIIGTTGLDSDVLELTGIASAFEETVEVPYISNGSEILAVLEESNIYKPDADQLTALKAKLDGKPLVDLMYVACTHLMCVATGVSLASSGYCISSKLLEE